MGKQDRLWWEAGLSCQDWKGYGQEVVRNPLLYLPPMDFHLGEHALGGNKEVCTVGEDGKKQGEGEVMAEVERDPRT